MFDADTLFLAANAVALWGWIALLASPLIPVWSDRIAGVVIPLLLCAAYTVLAALYMSSALAGESAGYFTLDAVMALFQSKEVVLVGWLHVLAFDLFIGAWIVRTARAEDIGFGWVIGCLIPTFLFGPAGLLLFFILRQVTSRGGDQLAH